ncbi:RING-H2 finger protein ATL75-like [Panicum miliaceum]|uniref:RING-type E3 ubiquitin transferase n=1 Tax=Panicum miliaceum TaxID=4540 RepID=A0A3L6RQ88_PANMI|nr:RING-H2 finger protein ATL75-like [Panicum miliaceum]
MLNLYPRLQLQASSAADGDDEDINVVCVTIFVFCVLVSTVSVWKALAFAALAAALLGAAGCFTPRGWFRRRSGSGAGAAELVVVTVTAGAARPGYPCSQVDGAPPAFALRCPLEVEAGGGAGEAASSVVCSVCLEDVRGGEMVRQVPACRHVFHVGCMDMWLHSHRTCPMCRCVVSPPEKVAPKDDTAAEEAAPPESSDDHELPPV